MSNQQKGLIFLKPRQSEQPAVDINKDLIIAKATEAYEKFNEATSAHRRFHFAYKVAEFMPELLRVLIDTDEQNQYLKLENDNLRQENEYSLAMREHLSQQLADSLVALKEQEGQY